MISYIHMRYCINVVCTDLFAWFQLCLPFAQLPTVRLFTFLQLGRLVFHQHLAFLVLQLFQLFDCCVTGRTQFLQLTLMFQLETLLFGLVTFLFILLELTHTHVRTMLNVLLFHDNHY